jgi:alginate O-acetyltransferase complex protein AlgI
MLFPSIPYLFIFLPIMAIVLYIIPPRFQWLWLLTCSTFFYYKLLPVYLILFFALIVMNYYLGIAIEKAGEKRKNIFIWSIAANIAVLAFFKYFGFLESLFAGIGKLSAIDSLAISE